MSIVWTPPPNNSARPPHFGPPGSDITSSLVALLLISPPTCSYPVPYRVHRASEDLLHWALHGQYPIPPSMHDRTIHVPTWDRPSCRLVTRFYPHELTSTQKRVEADEDFKEQQDRTGQAPPGGHVTKLRSHGTLISQLLPGYAEPKSRGRYRACIMLGIDLLSSRSGREREDTTLLVSFFKMTIRAALYVKPLALREDLLHKREILLCRYWRPKLNLANFFLQPYGQVCALSLSNVSLKITETDDDDDLAFSVFDAFRQVYHTVV
ncbi:hypothetical protein CROQUDRAFT_106574 [Cronartium quercuum f. sp. fusiforme G11]|uniref:Uncharacterized protein n=1 Tax=Cronartium quercuum f. sp. fusiforme G11 TaxID=708437 RepID=A0A9P6NNE2_9BASI|nr:hypothetical protein CROQUDRAFT_106574 [Cronartium quercuum f. sp. fusiforme G11]